MLNIDDLLEPMLVDSSSLVFSVTEENFSKKVALEEPKPADFMFETLTPATEAGPKTADPNLDLLKCWLATGAEMAEIASLKASEPESLMAVSSRMCKFGGCL